MRAMTVLALALATTTSCNCPPKRTEAPPTGGGTGPGTPAEVERTPLVPADHPLHGRLEGASFENGCRADADCFAAGCSGEVCSAQQGVTSTCDVVDFSLEGASCGCVAGQCVWWRAGAAPVPVPAEADAGAAQPTGASQGQPCADGRCAAGLTCLKYYGIAGPQGPEFSSCEIPCADANAKCPDGQRCVTIADGPGQVCRLINDQLRLIEPGTGGRESPND